MLHVLCIVDAKYMYITVKYKVHYALTSRVLLMMSDLRHTRRKPFCRLRDSIPSTSVHQCGCVPFMKIKKSQTFWPLLYRTVHLYWVYFEGWGEYLMFPPREWEGLGAWLSHFWESKKTKVKVKSSMARSLPVENLLPQNVGSIINYLQ